MVHNGNIFVVTANGIVIGAFVKKSDAVAKANACVCEEVVALGEQNVNCKVYDTECEKIVRSEVDDYKVVVVETTLK